ncbi:response regulator [Polaribacter aestuariivivens]|uniref:histidine kinase n=1 Tax=Polaribacter aestuariivivens TaxID=2304626 RepID=A0A5S3NAG6_9FLAO|nr:response regulator [Polaribacter aestuariivivens]TMM32112.1 response regulator [Polaribacter aestuariivivens]
MFKWYNKILEIGIDKNLDRTEVKRVRLLNLFWSQWIIIQLVLITEDAIRNPEPFLPILIHTITLTGVISIYFFQKNKKFNTARILFFLLMLYSNVAFANFIEPGKNIEYFYIIIPPFLLLFTNNSKLIYATFIVCYLLFTVPKNILDIYPENTQNSSVLGLILFVIIFLLVNYFKSTNVKSEIALEEQRNQLENLNRQQSQFFINVSHEIRTPLTLLKGQLDKLKIHKNDDQIEHIQEQANYQIHKIKKIIDDVIDLAKMETSNFSLNLKENNIVNLVQKIKISFEPLFERKKIDFTFHSNSNEIHCSLDTSFFERAINNIILNALKYTPENGKVSITIETQDNHVILKISDTGIGINSKDLQKIFKRFYQVENDINKSGGSGVGLSFSKEIIKKHAGTLKVKSKLNEGSEFIIKIPTKNLQQETISLKNKIEIESNNAIDNSQINQSEKINKNILIVDDSYEMRDYLKEILSNYNCFEAENGLEALKTVNEQKIDCIITDYMMPKMNGLELIKNLNKIGYKNPILMLTARTDYSSKLEVLRLGIDDYLHKPFEAEELLVRLQNRLSNANKRDVYIEKEKIADAHTTDTDQNWLLEIKEYIHTNCGKQKLNQEDLSVYFNMSKSSFYRKIKALTGLTPNEFITEIKLQKAKILIEKREVHSLKQLTLEVGFSHSSYFSTKYFKRFGVFPNKEIENNFQ